MIYAPGQIELKLIDFPKIQWFDKKAGGYHKMCKSLGFKIKYKHTQLKEQFNNIEDCNIICDSREQKLIKFETVKSEVRGLNYGDYSISEPYDSVYTLKKNQLMILQRVLAKILKG